MNTFKPLNFLALALTLFAALALFACSDGPGIPAGGHDTSGMTQTQVEVATGNSITIAPNTKTLILQNAGGKTIYMARTNPFNNTIKNKNTRAAWLTSVASSNAEKSVEPSSDFLSDSLVSGFEIRGTDDPRKKIYDTFQKNLNAAKKSSVSKSAAPQAIQAAVTNYVVGNEEQFWALDPKTLNSFSKRTFKLLVSEEKYNVWVDKEDKYYKDDFEAKAQSLGTSFINGYNLVSHLYGQPAENLYNNKDDSVYGPMETFSRTGLKINIMLYDMMDQGKVYGFVYHGDVYHGIEGSNEGRFVYIDSQTTLKTPLEANSTAQHEFSHTISRNQKIIVKKTNEWTYWYGELLAMICEDMMQSYLGIDDSDTGAGGGMGNTPKARLPQANALAWINGISGEDSLAYASIFQFGAWLTRNFGGAKFIKELAQNSYVDMESVLKAVNAMGMGIYTQESLLQKYAGDLLVLEAGKGFNKDAKTYSGDSDYTCDYTDESGTHTYLYPLTAIDLWDNFYGWCDTTKEEIAKSGLNKTIAFSDLPGANMYKKADWSKRGGEPEKAYLGPMLFKSGRTLANIGPYGSMIFNLGKATSNSVKVNFGCSDYYFSDVVTIWAK